MKEKIGLIIATLFFVAVGINSCKNNENIDLTVKQEVVFSFEQKDLGLKSSLKLKLSYLKEAAKYVVVSIEKSNGGKVYESKRLELFNTDGSFISQSLSLEVDGSPYQLTQFLVTDENYNVIFATPLKDSPLAYLVTNSLPISFTLSKNQITKVVPEVLSTEFVPIQDFGYAAFDFKVIVTPIQFLIGVQIFNPVTTNWESTTANVLIRRYPYETILYNDSIAAATDTVKVEDGYDNYRISISKTGFKYIKKDTILTIEQLKTYLNKPILILLKNEAGPVSDIDGNTYNTLTIGTQVWMAENLRTTKYRNGDPIPNVTDNSVWKALTSGGYCWLNNDATANKNTYGALYNWFSVSDIRNIAPAGWHVPTDVEWKTLTDYLGGENIAGGKLKETGTAHWESPNNGATNESGFTGLPGNRRNADGTFSTVPGGYDGEWWSITPNGSNNAGYFRLNVGNSKVFIGFIYNTYGLSVRCIKD